MNRFIELLVESGFERTGETLSQPLVVHAVAGAGKTSLVRQYLSLNPNSLAFTHGVPDKRNLQNRFIRPYDDPVPGYFCILDEYSADDYTERWDVLIADPLQHKNEPLVPHYIKRTSHRLGRGTQEILAGLGVHLEGLNEEEEVSVTHILEGEIRGTVIALDPAAKHLLLDHGVKPLCPSKTLGAEFPETTVVSFKPLQDFTDISELYIALTRHTRRLNVRTTGLPHRTP